MRPAASVGADGTASWRRGNRRGKESPCRGRRPVGSCQACESNSGERTRCGPVILYAKRPPQKVRIRPAERVYLAGLQVAKFYRGRREQQRINLIEVPVVSFEDFRKWSTVVGGGARRYLGTYLVNDLVIRPHPQHHSSTKQDRVVGPADGLALVTGDRRARGHPVAGHDLVQVEFEFVQLVQGRLQAPRHDLNGAGHARRRGHKQGELFRRTGETANDVSNDFVGRVLSGLEYTDGAGRLLAARNVIEERFPSRGGPHRPGAHGEEFSHLDLPAGVLRRQASADRIVRGDLDQWAVASGLKRHVGLSRGAHAGHLQARL